MKFKVSFPINNSTIIMDFPTLTSPSTTTLSQFIQSLLQHSQLPIDLFNNKQSSSSSTTNTTSSLSIKIGFPPTKLNLDQEEGLLLDKTLQELKIVNGEKMIIEWIESSNSTNSGGDRIIKGKTIGPYIPPSNNQGYFVRRIQPSDNSCLFHSLSYVLDYKHQQQHDSSQQLQSVHKLRELCANVVAENPKRYTREVLEMKPIEYANWILHEQTWGGAIEISIVSEQYKLRIVAFDTTTCREDVYGSDHDEYCAMALIIYTGSHYDALSLNVGGEGGSLDKDVTLFNIKDTVIMGKARAYVQEEHRKYLQRKK